MISCRPFSRRAEWAIAFAIALAVMLAGGGIMFWTVYSKSRLPSLTNLGLLSTPVDKPFDLTYLTQIVGMDRTHGHLV